MTASAHPTRKVTISCPFCARMNRVDLARLSQGPRCAECHRPLQLDRPQKVSGERFDQTIAGAEVPVLVDFYADWCGPCHMMAPTLDELAGDRQGELLVLKVDTDRDQALAARFGIKGLPTVVAFRDGKEAGRQVGVADRAALERLLQ